MVQPYFCIGLKFQLLICTALQLKHATTFDAISNQKSEEPVEWDALKHPRQGVVQKVLGGAHTY